jgi:type II secretory pathway pseudopilin PulG
MASISEKATRRTYISTGFSVLELLLVVAVSLVMTAMTMPSALSAIKSYQLDAASDSASGIIQGARYQAIMHGYPYQVDFNASTNQYQLLSKVPPATSFSAVGSAVPISGSQVTMGVGTPGSGFPSQLILQLSPNGSITTASGQSMPVTLTISYNGTTKHLKVSNYGSLSITSTTP